jgi:hypothetical protein
VDDNASGFCEGSRLAGLPEFVPEPAKTRRKGNNMTTNQSPKDIERLIDEADELVQRINFDLLNEMEEDHRLQFEIHVQKLEKIKSEVKGGSDTKKAWTAGSSAEGIHEAILDIVKAMQGFAKSLSG